MSQGRHRRADPEDVDRIVTAPTSAGNEPVVMDLQLGYSDTAPPPAPPPPVIERHPIEAATITAESISYTRVGRLILDDVSLSVEPGTSLAITGPSGSGKSSLLAVLSGLEPPDSGSLRRDAQRLLRAGIVLQGYGLVGVLSAAENVEAPLQAGALGRLRGADIRQRAAAALDAVGLSAVADHLVEELSGGQAQRAAVARALVIEPDVVFADELTAELDHEWRDGIVELVLDVARRGGSVLLATHDTDIAARCTRSIRLVDGRLA